MRFFHLRLENWRNFLKVDVDLQHRVFLVGPNASGKSNFLDVFRFLRDVADPEGGGLQRAVQERRGVAQLRSLHARRHSNVVVDARVDLGDGAPWRYQLEFNQDPQRKPVVKVEKSWHGDELVLDRPDDMDEADPKRLTQTTLEQVNANKDIRPLATFFAEIRYLHLVPQLVRRPEHAARRVRDPYGSDFLEQVARTSAKTRNSRLGRIQKALQVAVPQLKELKLDRDEAGVPHLYGRYEHWRPNAGWQTEEEFSDGTLRLLGLLWVLLDGTAPLLLEEPELSLHTAVVRHVPRMMVRLDRKASRQALVSTHSADVLSEQGIAPEEVLCLMPGKEGTEVHVAVEDEQVRALLEGGCSMAEAVMPRTAPRDTETLSLFGT